MSWTSAKIIPGNVRHGNAQEVKRGDPRYIMSRTELVEFAPCPDKWLKSGEAQFKPTKSTAFGSLVDCLATTLDEFDQKFVVRPSEYPERDKKGNETGKMKPWSGNSNWCEDWLARQESNGMTVISDDTLANAQSAVARLHENPAVHSLLGCSAKQVLIVADWHDEDTGLNVPFAALLDLVPHVSSPTWGKKLADLKTARNGDPATWAWVCDDSGYDVQAALYMDLHRAATSEDRTDFVHIVQENTFPFHVVNPPPAMSAEFLAWGRSKYRKALALYCRCLKTGAWPSYAQTGMPFGNTQIIGPDDLWNYRKCAGMTEFVAPEPRPEKEPESELLGITP